MDKQSVERFETAGEAPGQDEISLLDLLTALALRRGFILKITAAAAALFAILAFLLPNRFTATTVILPPQQASSTGNALMSQLGGLSSMAAMAGGGGGGLLSGLKNPNDLQVAMMKSETVEDAMIDRFHLKDLYHVKYMADARKKFEKNVSIDSGAKDGLIRISVEDRDPKRATEMANAYIEEFKRLTGNIAVTEASQRRLFFENQLLGAKDNLANAEEALKKTEQQSGLVQLDSQTRAVVTSVAQLRAQIAAKQVQIGAMRQYATSANPDLQVAEQELAGLEAQEQKMGGSSEQGLNMLPLPKGNLQQAGLEYVRKVRDVKYFETIFDLLARQYEAAKVDEARQGSIIQVVDRATVPEKHSSPKRAFLLVGGAVLGFCVGCAWTLAAWAVSRVKRNPAERARIDALRAAWGHAAEG